MTRTTDLSHLQEVHHTPDGENDPQGDKEDSHIEFDLLLDG